MIGEMERMLVNMKPYWDRDILYYLMKQFESPDDLQPMGIEKRGNMFEEYLYTISFPEWYMGHKTDMIPIVITCEWDEWELIRGRDWIVLNTFMY